jgi:hypothetical protein
MHISSVCNKIADALSRGQMQRFRELVPNAENLPVTGKLELILKLSKNLTALSYIIVVLGANETPINFEASISKDSRIPVLFSSVGFLHLEPTL